MANLMWDILMKLIAREKEKQNKTTKQNKTKITEEKKTVIMTLSKTLNTCTTTVYASLISLPLRHMLQDFYFLYNFRKIYRRIF